MEKKLYPFSFIPTAVRKPWGGKALAEKLDKQFVECDPEGNETVLGKDAILGESWELADMGFVDSVVKDGWLAGNTISELMETYLERVVGEDVYNRYGRQFPLLVKFLDVNGKLSVQVHPDDEVAFERYDTLGKAELWYVVDARPGARAYVGFAREVSAQEFYDRCKNGTVEEVLNVLYPRKGDVILIPPGTVHAADAGLLIAEIQESSDMSFRLYDWGREFDPQTARPMHLEEAFDVIDFRPFDKTLYRKGPEWDEEASFMPCGTEECHCGDEEHHHDDKGKVAETLVEIAPFNVTKINLTDPLHIYTEQFGTFIIYVCIEGGASIQVPSVDEKGNPNMEMYHVKKGETVLVPAEMPDFYLVPSDRSTVILEAVTRPVEEMDAYINEHSEAFLEGEDYEGLEDEFGDDEDDGHQGASPFSFFS